MLYGKVHPCAGDSHKALHSSHALGPHLLCVEGPFCWSFTQGVFPLRKY